MSPACPTRTGATPARVPRHRLTEVTEVTEVTDVTGSEDSKHILIVDDQADILEMTAMILSGAGYVVSRASSGMQALDHLATQRCDLVLLDINMPEMDGWETLRLIRADQDLTDLPVVMFSVKGEFRDKITGLQEGALDYITKPFEVDQLLYRVRRIFDTPRGGPAHRPPSQPVM